MNSYADFNEVLRCCPKGDIDKFIEKNIIDVVPFVFDGDEGRYFDFRKRVADKFNIDPANVYIVGSGCLGFSYQNGGRAFSLESDIDVAIVDEGLYEQYSRILPSYHYDVIHHRIPMRGYQKKRYYQFIEYFAVGWLRPDKCIDLMNKHPCMDDWWVYFKSISYNNSEVGDYKVNAGIYKSMHYLYKYQQIGLLNHRKGII